MNSDLPPRLSLVQTIAWISLRDPVMVERAGDLLTPSQGSLTEAALPSGQVELIHTPGQPGLDLAKIALHRWLNINDGRAVGPDALPAVEELLSRLREPDLLIAQGRHVQEARFTPIPSIEWEEMGIGSEFGASNRLFACKLWPDRSPSAEPAVWRDVRLGRADVERLWRGFEGKHTAIADSNLGGLDAREAKALEWMVQAQRHALERYGRPLAVRALGRDMKVATGLPVRLADSLYGRLPSDLRNVPRR